MTGQDSTTANPVVTKSEFARQIGVSAARISQYIAEKKISGDALVGEGRGAKIRVFVAKAQLRRFLDISQRFGNGIDTRLGDPAQSDPQVTAAAPPATPSQAEPALPLEPVAETVEDQIKREKLEGLQRANRKLAEDEAARAGRYVLADVVARDMGRALSQQVAWFEGVLSELATAIASKHAVPQRDVLHLLRSEFRACRERASTKFQTDAQALPKVVEDELAIEQADADLVEA